MSAAVRTPEIFQKKKYTLHQDRKECAQEEKKKDKERTLNESNLKVISMDLQRVLLCPFLLASALYYKTKLCTHNFTVYDLRDHDVLCFLWHEAEGGISANEFAMCLYIYLERCVSDFEEVIISSYCCTYQNRISVMAVALSYFALKYDKIVVQKWRLTVVNPKLRSAWRIARFMPSLITSVSYEKPDTTQHHTGLITWNMTFS